MWTDEWQSERDREKSKEMPNRNDDCKSLNMNVWNVRITLSCYRFFFCIHCLFILFVAFMFVSYTFVHQLHRMWKFSLESSIFCRWTNGNNKKWTSAWMQIELCEHDHSNWQAHETQNNPRDYFLFFFFPFSSRVLLSIAKFFLYWTFDLTFDSTQIHNQRPFCGSSFSVAKNR